MKWIKFGVSMVAGAVLGWLGDSVMGIWGTLIGSIAGSVIGWWAAKRWSQEYE